MTGLSKVCLKTSIISTMVLVCTAVRAESFSTGQELSIDAAVNLVVQDNPGLAQMQERHKAFLEIPSQVGTLPDPIVGINAMSFPSSNFHRRQEPMTQIQLGLMQMIPFPGKLGLKKEAAELDAQAAGFAVDETRLQLIANTRTTWWQIYYLDHALETVQRNQEHFREFIQVARKKYETGTGLQQDVLLAQLELSRLLDQEIEVEAMRRHEAIALNVLLDQPRQIEIRLSDEVSQTLPEPLSPLNYFQLAENRPWLKQKSSLVESAQKKLESARKDYYPDFTLGLNYGDRRGDNPDGSSRDDFVSFMVGVKVPLYASKRQDKALTQRTLEAQSAQYAAIDARGQIQGAISKALNDYARAKDQFTLFKTSIVPQASQTVQSMLAAYQVNEVDFLNLVRAQITLLNYELQYWQALVQAKQALARLEAAVGEENIYE